MKQAIEDITEVIKGVLMLRDCSDIFRINQERVEHFRERAVIRGQDSNEVVIVLICVDDPLGGPVANSLMPGYDWQAIRDAGDIPYARGLAGRVGIQNLLNSIPTTAAAARKLQEHHSEDVAVVVIDFNTADVFTKNQYN